MKKYLLSFALIIVLQGHAANLLSGKWNISYDIQSRRMAVTYDGRTLLADAYCEAASGGETLRSYDAVAVSTEEQEVNDCFGTGRELLVSYTMAGGQTLIQTLAVYDGRPYVVAQLALTTGDGTAESNCMVPLKSDTQSTMMPPGRQNRMLFVPWDNDGFIRYASNTLRSELNSYSVTAIYNSESREGLVCGAVDHDLWKNAVRIVGSDYDKVDQLALISGYTDEHSHDSIQSEGTVMPHGTVVADTVRSARFIMGWFSDWRTGMETFGQACTLVAPRREWAAGAPYGWSSWGVQQTSISYQGIIDCADFIRDNLVPHGFHDREGRVVMSLDAWWNDNLSTQQVKDFVRYCKANNMIPGLYYGAFCRFGDLQSYVPGTSNKYRFRDIALKVHGRYKVVDGAYCLDPTHVATKQYMMSDIQKFKSWGVEYLKCDFMSNGAIEADEWYNKDCHTGIQAYSEGMAALMRYAGDGIYLDLSIAPAFPYQYTHGRRISCDAWGTTDHTRYVMNNTSYGWWLREVYVANDPDHLVMALRQDGGGVQTEAVNRARLTTGVVTGAFITGDNFSPNVTLWRDNDQSKGQLNNYWETSQERALKLLTIDDINEIPRTCSSFHPVYGNASTSVGAESLMTYETDRYVYVAAINYQTLMPISGQIPFTDLGIPPSLWEGSGVGIKELWTGSTVTTTTTALPYNVPASDARIYRIEKNETSGILLNLNPQTSTLKPIYDLQGRLVDKPRSASLYIKDGKKYFAK